MIGILCDYAIWPAKLLDGRLANQSSESHLPMRVITQDREVNVFYQSTKVVSALKPRPRRIFHAIFQEEFYLLNFFTLPSICLKQVWMDIPVSCVFLKFLSIKLHGMTTSIAKQCDRGRESFNGGFVIVFDWELPCTRIVTSQLGSQRSKRCSFRPFKCNFPCLWKTLWRQNAISMCLKCVGLNGKV